MAVSVKELTNQLLQYTITPSILNVESSGLITIVFSNNKNKSIFLEKIKLALPINGFNENGLCTEIKKDHIKAPQDWHIDVEEGVVTVLPPEEEHFEVKTSNRFQIQIKIDQIDPQIGQCNVGITEFATEERNQNFYQANTSNKSLAKFPKGFRFEDFRLSEEKIYSGEDLQCTWEASRIKDVEFVLSSDQFPFNLDPQQDKSIKTSDAFYSEEKSFKSITLVTKKSALLNIKLIAVVRDSRSHQILLAHPCAASSITIEPASVEDFEVDSSEIKYSDSVILTWQSYGKIAHYILELGNGVEKKLLGTDKRYEHTPSQTTTYRLRAYVSPTEMLNSSERKVVVYYPPHNAIQKLKVNQLTAMCVSAKKQYFAIGNTIRQLHAHAPIIQIGERSNALVLSSDSKKLWVAGSSGNVYLCQNDQITDKVPSVIKNPKAMALKDDRWIYVAGDTGICVVDTFDKSIKKFFGEKISNLLISNHLLFALHSSQHQLFIFILEGKSEPIKIPLGKQKYPHGLALDKNENKIYVANTGDNSVSVVNLKTGQIIDEIPVGNSPEAIIFHKGNLYVTNNFDNTISVIDCAHPKGSLLTIKNVGFTPRLLAAADVDSQVYVGCNDGLWHFWSNKVNSEEEKALSKKIPSSAIIKLDIKDDLKKNDFEELASFRENKIAEEFRSGQFGVFFPTLRQTEGTESSKENLSEIFSLTQLQHKNSFGAFFSTIEKKTATPTSTLNTQPK